MGLMYPFPVSEEEIDHVVVQDNQITLKSYGLPYIFWIYLFAVLGLLLVMYFAISPGLEKLLTSEEKIDHILSYTVYGTLIGGTLLSIGFFFYEKRIIKNKKNLIIATRLFYFPLWSRKYQLQNESFSIEKFLDSPNLAKIQKLEGMRAFENQGYFELFAHTNKGKIKIDRHNRKADLEKIKNLLEKY